MTDPSNLPAVRDEQPKREVAAVDTDSWIPVAASVIKLAEYIAPTEFVPKSLRNSPAATAAAILYGREVGLAPMTALTQTHVIEGKPAISAEGMRAMVLGAGHDLVVEATTGALCRMRARRAGTEHWTTLEWTIDMARAAGVAGKQVWKSYPRQMLQARCTTELVRLVFPDVIHGFRSLEELDRIDADVPEPDQGGAQTTAVQRGTRKRAAAKTSTAQAPTAPSTPAADIPLPGEPGYEDPAKTSAGGEAEGEAADPPADTDDDSGAVNGATVHDGAPAEGQPTTPNQAGEAVSAAPESSPDPSPAPDVPPSVERPESDPGSTAVAPGDDQDASAGEADVVDAVIVEDPPDEQPPAEPGPRYANRAQVRAVNTVLSKSFGVEDDERHRVVAALIGHPIDSLNYLTAAEVSPLLDALKLLDGREALVALVQASEERQARKDAES